jgi:hypothetical protein
MGEEILMWLGLFAVLGLIAGIVIFFGGNPSTFFQILLVLCFIGSILRR